MNRELVTTLVVKDLTLFFRNRFFAFITVLALVFYVLIYYLLPSSVDETFDIGIYAPDLPPLIVEQLEADGAVIHKMDSEEALKAAIEDDEFGIGIALPPNWTQGLASGSKEQANIYFASDFPDDLKEFYAILIQELAFMVSGQRLNIEVEGEILGPDMAGAQIPPRERMLPLMAVFVLMMETMGLASLISSEVEGGTLHALLVTPLRLEGLFLGKGLTGVGMTFVQVTLLLLVTGGLSQEPLLVLTALLLGSLMVTGIGFLIASVAKDLLTVIAWGMLAIIALAIPAFAILVPGIVSEWVKIIPSYYLVETVYQTTNFNMGWSDAAGNLLILLAFSAGFLVLGVLVLRRKLK
jgi:ABC-2 type transport system permease protein